MGFGVREPRTTSGEHVPRTALIYGAESSDVESVPRTSLKRGTGKNADIILVPQPSDSPNDPLNWPQWKKNMTFLSICLSVSMGSALGPLLSPVTGVIAEEFKVSISKAAQPGGYPLMSCALGALILQAWAPIFGKRSAFLVSTMILFTSTIWSAKVKAPNFNGLIAARTFYGFGVGAYESLTIPATGDYSLGKRILFLNMVAIGSPYLEPLLGGYVAQKYGWAMGFNIMIAFTGVALLAIVFACPETSYVRPSIYDTDMQSMEGIPQEKKTEVTTASEIEGSIAEYRNPPLVLDAVTEKPKTYWEELKPINGYITRQNPLKLLVRPFVCFLYPAVFWGFSVGGLWSAWVVGLAIVTAQIYAGPPNFFDPTRLGLLSLFPLIFLLVGCCLGIFEPEFRLILLLPVLLVGIPGLFGFGHYVSHSGEKWVAASALQGLIAFAAVLAASVSFGYVLDCHRDHSIDVTVSIILLRNMFWFGSSYFLPDWLVAAKTWKVFDVIGGIQLGITLCSFVIYVFGKQIRDYLHRNDPLKILGLV
ncbi:MFS general substrate transporter [Mollisia scopiformis]|uniref:MFS general substrate transporter n=1 Tax=Mollisia scopiformis TaxID=149040 RepID=A0A194XBZ4_MOLSC|nr:MFS general substrate transporter [Mollisia scopiformis]KUJ17693.1 MFS general substrate transporter [Mollisia scopiformis]